MTVRRSLIAAATAAMATVAAAFAARSRVDRDATHVVAIHAGGGDVPSNLLRVYVELSAAMEPGSAYEHIHLVDDRGRVIRDAFLELREELWSPDHRRLTLLFDPGRVKRGIRSNVEMGAPLAAGRRYRLVIDSTWRDARDRPLAQSFAQELRVAGIDSMPPDPSRWLVSSPRANTRDTLRVSFGEPLDHALAARLIRVVDMNGSPIDGHVALSANDREWMLVPSGPWRRGAQLRVDPALEDLAGNNLVRAFDSDRGNALPTSDKMLTDTVTRSLRVVVRQ
jgi:hypothetical protein